MIALVVALSLLCSVFGQIQPPQGDPECVLAPERHFVTNTLGCDRYFVCINGKAIEGACPVGYKFNPIAQLCDFAKNVDCKTCALYGLQKIADPNSCTIYYECANGARTQRLCPPGLQFNVQNGNCDIASVVNCDREGVLPPTGLPPTGLPPTGLPTEPTISTPRPPPPGGYPACVAGGQIFHAHQSLCSSFYLCINGYAWLLNCPAGLDWNQAVTACDFPASAQCSEIRPKGEIEWSDNMPMLGALLE